MILTRVWSSPNEFGLIGTQKYHVWKRLSAKIQPFKQKPHSYLLPCPLTLLICEHFSSSASCISAPARRAAFKRLQMIPWLPARPVFAIVYARIDIAPLYIATFACNRTFPKSLQPLFQSESTCEVLNISFHSYWNYHNTFHTKTRFEKETERNSKVFHCQEVI